MMVLEFEPQRRWEQTKHQVGQREGFHFLAKRTVFFVICYFIDVRTAV